MTLVLAKFRRARGQIDPGHFAAFGALCRFEEDVFSVAAEADAAAGTVGEKADLPGRLAAGRRNHFQVSIGPRSMVQKGDPGAVRRPVERAGFVVWAVE